MQRVSLKRLQKEKQNRIIDAKRNSVRTKSGKANSCLKQRWSLFQDTSCLAIDTTSRLATMYFQAFYSFTGHNYKYLIFDFSGETRIVRHLEGSIWRLDMISSKTAFGAVAVKETIDAAGNRLRTFPTSAYSFRNATVLLSPWPLLIIGNIINVLSQPRQMVTIEWCLWDQCFQQCYWVWNV